MATPPVREVPNSVTHVENNNTNIVTKAPNEPVSARVCIVSEDAIDVDAEHIAEIPTEELASDDANIFTRRTDQFKPACVEEISRLVKIGDDLTSQECSQVKALITEFADVFALSVSEVTMVEGAVHKLNIEPSTKFSMKVHQKPLTPHPWL